MVGVIFKDRCAITSASLSGFLSKVDVMVAKILDCASCPGWYPLVVKRGAFVEIFYADVNNLGSFSIKSYKSLSLSNFAFTFSDITVLHRSRGMTDYGAGTCSSVIFIGDGGGGIDTRSTTFSGVIMVFAFFSQPACAPASTNHWNWVSINTLFVAASSMMSRAMAANYSLSLDELERISLRLPLPCCCCFVLSFFLAIAISFDNF